MFAYYEEWTEQFFAELDRRGNHSRFDRGKAAVIMELLRKQLLSTHYIQYSARVLFAVGQADQKERAQIMEAIFTLSREEIAKRTQAGNMKQSILDTFDYVFDITAVPLKVEHS